MKKILIVLSIIAITVIKYLPNEKERAHMVWSWYISKKIHKYDSYYHGKGFVTLSEGANEYYRPKLEELFGKNCLTF